MVVDGNGTNNIGCFSSTTWTATVEGRGKGEDKDEEFGAPETEEHREGEGIANCVNVEDEYGDKLWK